MGIVSVPTHYSDELFALMAARMVSGRPMRGGEFERRMRADQKLTEALEGEAHPKMVERLRGIALDDDDENASSLLARWNFEADDDGG